MADFVKLFTLVSALLKQCSRKGCTETFIHGYEIPSKKNGKQNFICEGCEKEFTKAFENFGKQNCGFHCLKYVKRDLNNFLSTQKGEVFKPGKIKKKNVAIQAWEVFYLDLERSKPDLAEMSEEEYWERKMAEINKKFDERCTSFQNSEVFIAKFRALLAECSAETLIELMRCGEAHSLNHNPDELLCDGCQDYDEKVDLSHHTRGLGKIWRDTVKNLAEQK